MDGPVLLQRDGHGALIVRHWPPIRPEQAPGAAPFTLSELWAAPPQVNGGLVVEGDPPRGIGGVHSGRQNFKDGQKRVSARDPFQLADPWKAPRTVIGNG
ncbi:hypothetical protein AA309_21005 [Microvirga vignae]|uniref:Uncharacterized protein n=1 Tax=Microvirga vignae TaxID=1225564 RepID=A0A0H1RFH8_9HYPH|nr:hypothetical protein AA309_21005 [Microvirga vignae]